MTPPVLAWLALVWGLVYLITASSIGIVFRKAVARLGVWPMILVYCPACTGAWVALALHQFAPWPVPTVLYAPVDAMVISCGVMALIGHQWPSNVFSLEQQEAYDEPPGESEDE